MNRVEIKRIFYSVGFGNFCEEICKINEKEYRVVYDCGSTSTTCLEKRIKERGDAPIDLLFISHFHADHMNGLKYLADRKIEIKNIVIPHMTDNEKKYYLLHLLSVLDDVDDDIDFYEDIINGTKSDSHFIVFGDNTSSAPFTEGMDLPYDAPSDYYPIDGHAGFRKGQRTATRMKNGQIIGLQLLWQYIPFYYKSTENIEMIDKMEKLFPDLFVTSRSSVKLDQVYLNDNLDRIKAAVKLHFNDNDKINASSLVVYSGIQIGRLTSHSYMGHHAYPHYGVRFLWHEKTSCLYCGDYNAKDYFHDLMMFYSSLFSYLGTIQIPHHGSKENHNIRLIKSAHTMVICSSTAEIGKRHPSEFVINEILDNDRNLIIVNEHEWSTYSELIEVVY